LFIAVVVVLANYSVTTSWGL